MWCIVKNCYRNVFAGMLVCCLPVALLHAQDGSERRKPLFASESILSFTITGDAKGLLRDRGENVEYHPISLTYFDSVKNEPVTIQLKARCRGNFRKDRSNCLMPPVLLNFPKNDTVKQSVFRKQDKLKLVTSCRNGDYVVREYLLYKMYELLTPRGFQTRLVRVQLEGEGLRKFEREPFVGFLIEDENDMAERTGGHLIESKSLKPQQTHFTTYLDMVLFQYMIGNVDWSLPYEHNIKLVGGDSASVPWAVPYDFDHAGFVDAPYAHPPEELQMTSLRERRFRGYCIQDMNIYKPSIERFNDLRQDWYAIVNNCSMIDDAFKKKTIDWLDDFYNTINDEKKLSREFSYPCTSNTSGINIGGLKQQ